MLAEVVDAVVDGDMHRDTHAQWRNHRHADDRQRRARLCRGDRLGRRACAGPRVVVGLEGTRSYGIGLARVLQAAGLTVVEIERPRRGERRRGKSDPIDAHLAALHALRLDADRLPTPRADGGREALPFCSALAGNSPQPRLGRSIGCARCRSPAVTPIERCPAAR
jgi:transposase